jgi:hypothetical protein
MSTALSTATVVQYFSHIGLFSDHCIESIDCFTMFAVKLELSPLACELKIIGSGVHGCQEMEGVPDCLILLLYQLCPMSKRLSLSLFLGSLAPFPLLM